ncbi:MAG TPA: MXAN_5187 family protein, partial [Myxococcales bacterium]|nr:MXAN_5187 family protein [Myxococcales bacterium]
YEAPPEDPFSQYRPPDPDFEGTRRDASPFARPGQDLSASEPESDMEKTPGPETDPYRPVPMETVPHFSSDPNIPAISQDDNPDATRVATVPQELLEASARTTRANVAAPRASGPISLPKMPAVAAAPVNPEEAHFQEIYREFVATRKRCGEGEDGLTYDKFALKLRKNKEQLVQKYNCKTVRFQVYVKEGKAALKATPVKE